MKKNWAAHLDLPATASLGALRLVKGLEVCEMPDGLWLRGDQWDEALELALRSLPGARRYFALADGQLVPTGRRVPTARLPQGPWRSLAEWLEPTLPMPHLAGVAPERVTLRLVPEGEETAPELLLVSQDAWRAWTRAAPQVRLDRLEYACSSEGRILVRGEPLPPIPGQALVVRSGVAVPAGWAWRPRLDSATVRESLGLIDEELALLWPDGSWERVPHDAFTRAGR